MKKGMGFASKECGVYRGWQWWVTNKEGRRISHKIIRQKMKIKLDKIENL